MRTRTFRSAIGVFLVLGLTACGSGADESGSPKTTAGGEASSFDESATLRVANDYGVGTWDVPAGPGGPEGSLLSHVFDRLVHTTPAGEPAPGIAESWAFDESNTSLTLTLRPGLTFTDGTVLDGKAVKANLDRHRSLEESTIKTLMSNLEEVEAVDATTVRIRQASPDVSLVLLLADRPGMMMSPASFDDPKLAEEPVGSGMFRLVKQTPGASYTLERNEDYWDLDSVKVAEVTWDVLPAAEARLNALRSGAADLVRLDAAQLQEAQQGGLAVVTGPSPRVGILQINAERVPAWKDAKVRKAVSLAIDRQGLVDGVLFGAPEPSLQLMPAGHWAHNDELISADGYDPDKARQLLADAGHADGLTLDAMYPTPSTDTIATAVQGQLAEIGIKLNLTPGPGTLAGQTFWTDKATDGMVAAFTGRPDPSIGWQALYMTPQFLNPGALADPEVTELIEESKTVEDIDERGELLKEVAALIAEDPLGTVPLFIDIQVLGTAKAVAGLEAYSSTGWLNLAGVGLQAG